MRRLIAPFEAQDGVSYQPAPAVWKGLSVTPVDVRFGSKADICAAKSDVRFIPNSDRKSGFPQKVMSALPPKADTCSALAYVCLGPKADIDSVHSITSSARIAGKAWLPNIATAQSASTSDHLSLDCGQSEQQDYPERTEGSRMGYLGVARGAKVTARH